MLQFSGLGNYSLAMQQSSQSKISSHLATSSLPALSKMKAAVLQESSEGVQHPEVCLSLNNPNLFNCVSLHLPQKFTCPQVPTPIDVTSQLLLTEIQCFLQMITQVYQ